jgi:hypothetical protein
MEEEVINRRPKQAPMLDAEQEEDKQEPIDNQPEQLQEQ